MKRVVLIDDDSDDAGLFNEALEEVKPGIEFRHFDNGREALNSFESETYPLPDLIFLDINLPVFSGWDFLKKMKENGLLSRIPVVMYTTSSQRREKEIAEDLGARGFITKPNEYRELKKVLEGVLEEFKV